MAGIIGLNGDKSIPQPATLKEDIIRKVVDRTSIKGTTRRIWLADKHQVTMQFTAISISEYNKLFSYLYNQSNPVTYTNSVTGWNFTGFVTKGEDQFMPGNSWLKNLTITIEET